MSIDISQIVVGTISPYMINPTEANWKGKVGYFWVSDLVRRDADRTYTS
jgi:hypothetical protein